MHIFCGAEIHHLKILVIIHLGANDAEQFLTAAHVNDYGQPPRHYTINMLIIYLYHVHVPRYTKLFKGMKFEKNYFLTKIMDIMPHNM